jgi:hypothetical protein
MARRRSNPEVRITSQQTLAGVAQQYFPRHRLVLLIGDTDEPISLIGPDVAFWLGDVNRPLTEVRDVLPPLVVAEGDRGSAPKDALVALALTALERGTAGILFTNPGSTREAVSYEDLRAAVPGRRLPPFGMAKGLAGPVRPVGFPEYECPRPSCGGRRVTVPLGGGTPNCPECGGPMKKVKKA